MDYNICFILDNCSGVSLCRPEKASSACGRKHGESPPQRPTADCGPNSAGCQCMDPYKKNKKKKLCIIVNVVVNDLSYNVSVSIS